MNMALFQLNVCVFGRWVVYEYSNYKGCQMLLQPGELPVWGEHSGWDTIGSLRPLKQVKHTHKIDNHSNHSYV